MSKNRYESQAKQAQKASTKDEERLNQLTKSRLRISTDFSGNSLSELLSESDKKAAKEFLTFMKNRRFPAAETINLRKRRFSGSTKHHERADYVTKTSTRLVRLASWTRLWSGKGYLIGAFYSVHDTSPNLRYASRVYLCTDGRLRCERSLPLFISNQSVVSGYGSAPPATEISNDITFSTGDFSKAAPSESEMGFEVRSLESLLNEFVGRVIRQ